MAASNLLPTILTKKSKIYKIIYFSRWHVAARGYESLQMAAISVSHLQPLAQAAACSYKQPLAQADTSSHKQPQAATSSHLPKQPLAATCSHLQPLAATCPSSHLQPQAATWSQIIMLMSYHIPQHRLWVSRNKGYGATVRDGNDGETTGFWYSINLRHVEP